MKKLWKWALSGWRITRGIKLSERFGLRANDDNYGIKSEVMKKLSTVLLVGSYVANILPVRPTANTVCRDTRDGVEEARVPYALTSRC